MHVVVKTPIMRPALPTIPDLADRVRELGVEWSPDSELTESYGGASYPLQFSVSADDQDHLARLVPEVRPSTASTKEGLCLAGRQFCFVDVFETHAHVAGIDDLGVGDFVA